MRALIAAALLSVVPLGGAVAQDEISVRGRVDLGAVFGSGSGPTDSRMVGAEVGVGVPGPVRLRARYGEWWSGVGVGCPASWPESYGCSVEGSALLGGVEWPFHNGGRLTAYLAGLAGRFARSAEPSSDQGVESFASAFELGAHVRLVGPLFGRVGVRWTKAWDDDYEGLMGEDLEYRMLALAFGVEVD